MLGSVKISFTPAYENDPSPRVVVYNPNTMPAPLLSQVLRFGLHKSMDKKDSLIGQLKGERDDFIKVIQSYGYGVELVHL